MRFERLLTKENEEIYDNIPFRSASSEIRNPDGTIVFSAADIEVPEQYSQVATDIISQKYFRNGKKIKFTLFIFQNFEIRKYFKNEKFPKINSAKNQFCKY